MKEQLEDKPIRILNIVPNMRAAGIENFIMNIYRNIDRNKIQFDFIVHNKERKFFDDEIEQLGGKIYRFTLKDDKNFLKYKKDLDNFFKEHKEYKIFHGHMQSMIPLYMKVAKKNEVPIRIAHSHNGDYEHSIKGYILHLFSRFASKYTTDNWACSEVAGKYLFGNKNFKVIYNGIDTQKFMFDKNKRIEMRKKLNIKEDEILIGHVGRFQKQKNHEFIVKLVKELNKNDKKKFKIILIGEGELEEKIRKQVNDLNLDNIQFLGVRKEINKIYNAMDCFILPSLYEGLPLVGVEAQVNSLPCFFSDTITPELNISPRSQFIELNNVKKWAEKIENYDYACRNTEENDIDFEKFDIEIIANSIQEKYLNLIEGSAKNEEKN